MKKAKELATVVEPDPLPPMPPVVVPTGDDEDGGLNNGSERITVVLPTDTVAAMDWYRRHSNCTRAAVVHKAIYALLSQDPLVEQRRVVKAQMSDLEKA